MSTCANNIFNSEWLVWLVISLLCANWLQEARGFTLLSDPDSDRSPVTAAPSNGSAVRELACVLSEEREQESLLPELRDSIRLPPGREN